MTGKGLQVYSSIPATEADDFKGLRKALLKRYQLTEDGFRHKFGTSNPESGETVFQFVGRLSGYFKRWVDLTEVKQNYLRFSFANNSLVHVAKALGFFLPERMPKSVEEMTKLADQFMEAHGGSITMTKKQQKTDKPHSLTLMELARPTVVQQNAGSKDKFCYYCGRNNHVIAECRIQERDMRKKSVASGQDRSDVSDWRYEDQ